MKISFLFVSMVFILASGGETTWRKIIADKNEPGERMIIHGVVLRPDGKTPAPGIRMTVYHTDAKGIYPPQKPSDGSKPRLRGLLVTNEKGEYEIRTIRPGAYPGGKNAAHVHFVVHRENGRDRNYTLMFSDDPTLSGRERNAGAGREYTGDVQKPERTEDGSWKIRRDILLEE